MKFIVLRFTADIGSPLFFSYCFSFVTAADHDFSYRILYPSTEFLLLSCRLIFPASFFVLVLSRYDLFSQ